MAWLVTLSRCFGFVINQTKPSISVFLLNRKVYHMNLMSLYITTLAYASFNSYIPALITIKKNKIILSDLLTSVGKPWEGRLSYRFTFKIQM